MKNIAITSLLLVIIVILALTLISFQVRQTEAVLVTTFGKLADEPIVKPGFHFKWPPPIQNIYRYDSRLRIYEADLIETATKGNKPLVINTYVVWRIADALQFHKALGTVSAAEEKLRSRLNNMQSAVVGQYYFSDFVNSDPNQIKIDKVQEKMLALVQQPVMEDFGIEIKDLGIKQLKINEESTKQVFQQMIAERNTRTTNIQSQGQAYADKIRQDAISKEKELSAFVEGRAQEIRGEGDTKAARYYEMLEKNANFAMFLRDLEAYKIIFDKKTTFVISADQEPFTLLKEAPKVGPQFNFDMNK